MTRILAIANQKGGVGKTTTAISVATNVALAGHRTLLVDADPQGNATTGLGVNPRTLESSTYNVVVQQLPISAARTATIVDDLDLLPANLDLAGAEVELVPMFSRELRLRSALSLVVNDYDYVLIDCPPSLGMLTVNSLAAAHEVVIPLQCEYYALEGLSGLLETIARVRQSSNSGLAIEGLLRTMFDGRTSLSNEVSEQLQQHFGSKVFRTVVPRNVRLAEAPSHGKPVIDYDRSCIGTQAYLALAGELVGPTRGDVHSTQAIHSADGETTGSDRAASPAGNAKW